MFKGETPGAEGWLDRLVGYDTTSNLSNLALIDDVAAFLKDHGVAVRLDYNADGTKANLFASIGGSEPGGVVLSGHTDVVPVAGQAWTSDPFSLRLDGDKLVGRGSADMKGFIAVVLSLVPRFAATPLRVPLHLCFSYDEEVGCQGIGSMIDLLGRELPQPAIAIIGEPTEMQVVNAHKGIASLKTRILGKPCHSSQPQNGVNAIAAAGRLLAEMTVIQEELKNKAPAQAADFDPPYTTINPGRIDGGTAVNIIAERCRLEWDCRAVPGDSVGLIQHRLQRFAEEKLLPAMRGVHAGAEIVTEIGVDVPPLLAKPGSPAEELVLQLTGHNRAVSVPYATEAGLFQDHGIAAVVCGPGSVLQAHRPDEFVTLGQLEACRGFLLKLLDWARR